MVWFIVGFVIVVLVVICCLSHIKVKASYQRSGKDDHFELQVKALFGLVRLKFNVPKIDLEGVDGIDLHLEMINNKNEQLLSEKDQEINQAKGKNSRKDYKSLLQHTDDFYGWARRTLRHVKCTAMKWHTTVGWTEAHITAVIVGLIWAVKSPLIGFMMNLVDLQAKPDLKVQPTYNTNFLSTDALCIVKIRLGYAIFAGISLIFRIVKVKGGVKTWKSILFKA